MKYTAKKPRIVTTHPTRRVLRRFFGNITVLPTGCWRWDGPLGREGYGKATWNYNATSAHRVAYSMFVREPLRGEHIDHLCRVRSCVNPAHLEAVSPAENTRRAIAAVTPEEREQKRRDRYQSFLTDRRSA